MASGLSTLIQPSLILAKELSSPLFLNALKKKKRKMQTHTKIMSTKGYLSFLSMQIILFSLLLISQTHLTAKFKRLY